MYIAQTKEKKKYTYFHEDTTSNSSPSSVNEQPMKGSKYAYTEDWGEKYVNTSSTCIAIVDVISGTVKVIPLLDMDDYTVGQAQFVPNTSRIVFTAWSNSPRKLGMIYCYHRQCNIYITDHTSEVFSAANGTKVSCRNLSAGFALARSARFNKTGSYLAFLGSKSGYTSHNGAQTLYYIQGLADAATCSFDYNNEPVETLPIISTPASSLDFPGIFANNIPKNGFISDDEVALNSAWGSVDSIILVSLSTKSVLRLSSEISQRLGLDGDNEWNSARDYSVQLLDATSDVILFAYSSPSLTQQFGVFDRANKAVTTTANDNSYSIKWKSPGKPVDASRTKLLKEAVRAIRWKIFNFKDENGVPFDGVLILPPASHVSDKAVPGVIVPHGGPHSNFSTAFIAGYAYLVLALNVAVVYVNYRGSTGFGQDSINSLLGKIGTNDVSDTKHVTDYFIEKGFLDRERIGIVGGSHGGFLGAHMIGQYPALYKVAALRNPVTNIPQMVGTTDIPDWCYVEAGLTYNFTDVNLPSLADIEKMQNVSPVTYINNVTAPVLLCLGAKDRRVPYTQGLEYAQLLKAKGVKVSMLVFPEDCHALDKPTSEADQWVAIALHLTNYI